jgi:glycosyltransferase involved in cell wall biosynthesis
VTHVAAVVDGHRRPVGRLRIAQVAPVVESVPPARYGGTERVIATVVEELVRRGHEVTLFASGDSRTSARLVPIVDRALWRGDHPYRDFAAFAAITWGRLCREIQRFDVVHNHLAALGFLVGRARSGAPPPILTTLHSRLDLPECGPLYQEFADLPLVSISNAQRRPLRQANWVATIHHGIALSEFTFNPNPGAYLAFLGRISPDKGLDTAIHIARRAGQPLHVAARRPLPFQGDPEVRRDWEYWEQIIQPLLREPGVEFVGELGGTAKSQFLAGAAALLFPIRWPEPFGLVMPEALASGTPVLALRAGSVPEVIEDGVTGFVRDTADELVEAVGRIGELSRARCRAEAERRFAASAMADAYERVYARVVGRVLSLDEQPRTHGCPPGDRQPDRLLRAPSVARDGTLRPDLLEDQDRSLTTRSRGRR